MSNAPWPFSEHHDTVRISPFGHVVHAPTVGCLCELLVIDHYEDWLKPGFKAAWQDCLFQPCLASVNFAHFESNMTAGFEDTMQFLENLRHRLLPGFQLSRDREVDGFRINAEEPAAKPVVRCILDNVEEGR